MSEALNAKEEAFVEHYRKSRSVPAAAAAAGLSPRAASKLLARPSIKAEIERPDVPDASASAPAPPAGDREALLRELDRIVAGDGPDPAKVSALSLKARLLGLGDPPLAEGDEDETVVDSTPRDLARAILSDMADKNEQFRKLGLPMRFVVAYEGETILRVRDPDAAQMAAGEPALTVEAHLAAGSAVAERTPIYSPDGASIRLGDYSIEFTDRAVEGRSRPVAEWTIRDASGAIRGRRLTAEEAIAFAKMLPADNQTEGQWRR